MAKFFTPPVFPSTPTVAHADHPGTALFRFYRPWDAGVNVFLLLDGSVTQNEPVHDGVTPPPIRRTFHGGHVHPVDDSEAALLTAAGYVVVEVP